MTTPDTPPAAPDVAAIEARAAAATYAASVLLAAFRSPTSAAMASSECREALASAAVSAADVPTLLAHVRRLTAALADSDARVASAVAAERERCAAVCRDIASDATDDDPVSETADACAEAIERASAPTGGAQ